MTDSARKSLSLKFSIRHLLVATAAIATGCAALLNANEWWVSGLLSGTLAMLVVAIMLAVYRRERARAFWFGFALCGSAYLVVAKSSDAFGDAYYEEKIITTKLSQLAYYTLFGDWQACSSVIPVVGSIFDGSGDSPSRGLSFADSRLPSIPAPRNVLAQFGMQGDPFAANGTTTPEPFLSFRPVEQHFIDVAHCFWTLFLAFIGGKACQWIYLSRKPADNAAIA